VAWTKGTRLFGRNSASETRRGEKTRFGEWMMANETAANGFSRNDQRTCVNVHSTQSRVFFESPYTTDMRTHTHIYIFIGISTKCFLSPVRDGVLETCSISERNALTFRTNWARRGAGVHRNIHIYIYIYNTRKMINDAAAVFDLRSPGKFNYFR